MAAASCLATVKRVCGPKNPHSATGGRQLPPSLFTRYLACIPCRYASLVPLIVVRRREYIVAVKGW